MFGMTVTSSKLRPVTGRNPHFAPGSGSLNAKSCRPGCQMQQTHSKLLSTPDRGLSFTARLVATWMMYRYTPPLGRSGEDRYRQY